MNTIYTYYFKNRPIIFSFLLTIIVYLSYVIFRGFGWDGDSFISASQFQKLIGSDLYGLLDGAAHPKIFSIILFGLAYNINGDFYVLTILSILLNALMISIIIKWIIEERGIWIIALFGLLINIPWTKIVVNCDNPAFSMPFIIFGLFYIARKNYTYGAVLLLVSSLFRSGAEFIIFVLLIYTLWHKDLKNSIILFATFILSSIHTYWGYLIVYPTREYFFEITWKYLTSSESIDLYKHSIKSFFPYLNSIITQLFEKYYIIFLIPFILGILKVFRKPNTIKYLILTPVSSLILPVGSYIYGIAHRIYATKHMGFTFLLPIFSAFAVDKTILNNINGSIRKIILIAVTCFCIIFSIITGSIKNGEYEANIDGTGILKWINLVDIKKDIKLNYTDEKINILTAYKYLTFTYLDLGEYAYNIDIVKTIDNLNEFDIEQYDLVILPKDWKLDIDTYPNINFQIHSNNYYDYYQKYLSN